uniref:Uncharacterized protein n=1 Tax=Noctiluca scintillans TaxID=2966 RepID=A0A7S1AZ40_NOCSC|mmetsp:Transcript_64995/g.172005  ORF Transcript_64995/g.172005 Transcript_64995/m.172005 type:complete len:637 (+) Transcript_64995:62-1972(+)|eukprot:CAMPEP_0194505824 /NCGR_PEP_ID=MMETSP0253-20130528/33051_1 /TAXON_ID=2966 /ORGANISM="Noctiluca scintillans" /LENGTH=636 /DNA_ID=CAMNT_0039348445 /DNA_START=19 /DNA_END=1929 /DNA_ORIENTATION=-
MVALPATSLKGMALHHECEQLFELKGVVDVNRTHLEEKRDRPADPQQRADLGAWKRVRLNDEVDEVISSRVDASKDTCKARDAFTALRRPESSNPEDRDCEEGAGSYFPQQNRDLSLSLEVIHEQAFENINEREWPAMENQRQTARIASLEERLGRFEQRMITQVVSEVLKSAAVTGLSGINAQQLAALECRIHHVEQSGASCEQLTSSIQDVQIILQDVQERISFVEGVEKDVKQCLALPAKLLNHEAMVKDSSLPERVAVLEKGSSSEAVQESFQRFQEQLALQAMRLDRSLQQTNGSIQRLTDMCEATRGKTTDVENTLNLQMAGLNNLGESIDDLCDYIGLGRFETRQGQTESRTEDTSILKKGLEEAVYPGLDIRSASSNQKAALPPPLSPARHSLSAPSSPTSTPYMEFSRLNEDPLPSVTGVPVQPPTSPSRTKTPLRLTETVLAVQASQFKDIHRIDEEALSSVSEEGASVGAEEKSDQQRTGPKTLFASRHTTAAPPRSREASSSPTRQLSPPKGNSRVRPPSPLTSNRGAVVGGTASIPSSPSAASSPPKTGVRKSVCSEKRSPRTRAISSTGSWNGNLTIPDTRTSSSPGRGTRRALACRARRCGQSGDCPATPSSEQELQLSAQ